jgi:hypothetical protein
MTGFFAVTFRTLQRTFTSQPGRVSYSRRRSWDLFLRRFAPVHRVEDRLSPTSAPTCRFVLRFSATVFVAGCGRLPAGIVETPDRGSWGLAPITSRVLRIAGPAIALPGPLNCTDRSCRGFLFLFQVFGVRL